VGFGSHKIWAIGLLFAGWGVPLAAQEAGTADDLTIAARQFGAREDVLDISLSPSGNKIAFVSAGPGHSEILSVIDLAGDAVPKRILANSEMIADLDWCEWATEERLVCQVSGMAENAQKVLLPYDRLFAINADGSNLREMSKRQSANEVQLAQSGGDVLAFDVGEEPGQILMSRQYVPELAGGTRVARTDTGFGVDLVDVNSGKRRVRERPDPEAVNYVSDETGRLRVKVHEEADSQGQLKGQTTYFYRTVDSNSWQKFKALTLDGAPVRKFAPVSVNSAANVAYGFVESGGYTAIAEFALRLSALGASAGSWARATPPKSAKSPISIRAWPNWPRISPKRCPISP
jgi:hypothetical protein